MIGFTTLKPVLCWMGIGVLLRQMLLVSTSTAATSSVPGAVSPDDSASEIAHVVDLGSGRPHAAALVNGGEKELYERLVRLSSKYAVLIVPKVRVLDVIGSDNERVTPEQRNYAFKAHFDFTILYKATMTPVVVVELDGAQHASDSATQRRDAIKDQLCAHIDLPIVRVQFGWWGGLLPVEQALERYFSLPASTDLYQTMK